MVEPEAKDRTVCVWKALAFVRGSSIEPGLTSDIW